MNPLNKGRCKRCKLSRTKEIKVGDLIPNLYKIKVWLWCNKYKNYCRYCSSHCKESPMGEK